MQCLFDNEKVCAGGLSKDITGIHTNQESKVLHWLADEVTNVKPKKSLLKFPSCI